MGGNFAREWCGFTRHTVSGAARFAFFIIWFKNSIPSPSGAPTRVGPRATNATSGPAKNAITPTSRWRQLAVTAPSSRETVQKDGGTSRTAVDASGTAPGQMTFTG